MNLRNIPTRVLRSTEPETADAQRISQAGFQRTNLAIEAVNGLRSTPFGAGQMLTQPDGVGGRTELLTLAPGANVIGHTLGAPVQGFVVCDIQADVPTAYGAWHDMTTQVAPAINVAVPMHFGATDSELGVTLDPATQEFVTVAQAGTYNLQFSAQLDKTAGGTANWWVWPVVNGVAVTASASQIRVQGNNAEVVPAWNFLLSLAAGDTVALYWAIDDLTVQIQALAAAGVVPAIPSVIMTLVEVGGGPILQRVERTRSEDSRSIELAATRACSARIWVW